jgi:hypothetical protein
MSTPLRARQDFKVGISRYFLRETNACSHALDGVTSVIYLAMQRLLDGSGYNIRRVPD